MKKLLITGFDPFGGEAINPSYEAVKLLPDTIGDIELIKLEIPTEFGEAIDQTVEAIEEHQPDFVISVGQAGGRSEVTPERVAINIDDARIPDNQQLQPLNEPIYPNQTPAYFSNLPVKAMVESIQNAGLPASLSNTAGTFVCNHVMYGTLHHIVTRRLSHIKSGFIHVPYIPEQVVDKPDQPSLPLTDIAKALEAAIDALNHHEIDIQTALGKIN